MGLLDRFRAQPRWKNANPTVRASAVEELPLDQQDTIIAIAREDRDPAVRLTALKKVIDPAIIATIARDDRDERVREEAVTLLVDLATGAFEGTDQAESLTALGGLTETKHLVAVARGAGSEAVARAALDRVRDEGSLGSIARRATLPSVRLEALGRVMGPTELAEIALRSEFKDVTVAAVERLSDQALLEDVASRARNKTAAKRARALAKAAETVAAARPTPLVVDPGVEAEQRRRRTARALCDRLATFGARGLDEGEAVLEEIDRGWQALGELDDAELTTRFQTARAAAEETWRRHLAERAERARILQENAAAIAARRVIVERVEGLAGDDTPGGLEQSRSAWAGVPALSDEGEAARWERRFDEACRTCDQRYRALVARRTLCDKARQVCAEAERLAESAVFPQARPAVQSLRRVWQDLTATGLDEAALVSRFEAADSAIRAREVEARERRTREQQENLARLQRLCADLEAVVASEPLTLKSGERALREARAAIDDPGPLPSRADQDAVNARLERVLATLFPRIQELRDMDEWQRWANAGVQEDLCRRVEALLEVDDLAAAARQLRETQAQWKQVASAPREQSQALWLRFKTAADAVRARCDVYFARLAEEQAANRAHKEALCAQAEALSTSTDWIRTAEAIKVLQAEWKTVGPAPRPQEKPLWERFHAACDAFFTRRRDDLRRRKEEWGANLARKEALCAEAEQIAETTDWQQGLEQIKRLQAEWKTVGPVRKTRADVIWQRFRAACDRFFERYQQREQIAASGVIAEADAICQHLEALIPADGSDASPAPDGFRETVSSLRERWAAVSALLPRERALRLGDRVAHALGRLVDLWPAAFAETDLDPEVNLRKLEELCVQVERLLTPDTDGGAVGPAEAETPATLLARQLREALATNTIAGRPDDSARWKAVSERLRAAQAAWKRVGPVPEGIGRAVQARFHRACTRVTERLDQQRRGLPIK